MKKILLRIIISVLLLYLFPVSLVLTGLEPFGEVYIYSTEDGGFVARHNPSKMNSFKFYVMDPFMQYKKDVGKDDIELYRTFKMHPLKYWKYREYLSHPRWDFDYLPPQVRVKTE